MSKIHFETFSQQLLVQVAHLRCCLRLMSKIHFETFSQLLIPT